MQSDQSPAMEVPAALEPGKGKAKKKPQAKRDAKSPMELAGHVDAVSLDLEADAASALSFTLAPKSGAKRVISVEATGEARQAAITLLLAAKFADKKITVTLAARDGKQPVASALALKSKPRRKT